MNTVESELIPEKSFLLVGKYNVVFALNGEKLFELTLQQYNQLLSLLEKKLNSEPDR